jgi:carbonic anhydrase
VKKLIRGIADFRRKVRPEYRETFAKLALGQSPDALLVACSDSRVVPNLFASTEPGDLFVVRNPGNLISPCGADGHSVSDESEAAAIEFAVLGLGVPDVIVCGHSQCGALRPFLDGKAAPLPPHLKSWLKHAEPAAQALRSGERMSVEQSVDHHLSQLNVLRQLDHLRTYPIVKQRLDAGKLRLHAWWFDIAQAEVLAYDEIARRFIVIDDAEADRLIRQLG